MYNCAKCFQRGCTKQDMTKTLPDCPSKDEQVKEQANSCITNRKTTASPIVRRSPRQEAIARTPDSLKSSNSCIAAAIIRLELPSAPDCSRKRRRSSTSWSIMALKWCRLSARTGRSPRTFWESPTSRRLEAAAKPKRCAIRSDRRCF